MACSALSCEKPDSERNKKSKNTFANKSFGKI
jgi:hypothetical protein